MKYNDLKADKFKKNTRKGRGIAAGNGKTAGRGTKGQGARKSGGVRPGFEGGQMPLYMRIPKLRGFKSRSDEVFAVYTGDLAAIGKSTISPAELAEARYIDSPYSRVKIIAKGELNKKINVKAQFCSEGAKKIIESAGGKFEKIEQMKRQKKEQNKTK